MTCTDYRSYNNNPTSRYSKVITVTMDGPAPYELERRFPVMELKIMQNRFVLFHTDVATEAMAWLAVIACQTWHCSWSAVVLEAPFTRYNLLSNWFDNRLYHVYSRLSNRLYNPVWQPVERTVAVRSTRLKKQWLFDEHSGLGGLWACTRRNTHPLTYELATF